MESACAEGSNVAHCEIVNQRPQKRFSRVLLCVALSILLHVLLGLLILLIPPQERVKRAKAARKARPVKVVRTAARKKADAKKQQAAAPKEEPKAPSKQKPFAKTSADTPQATPDQHDYEGRRSTRAASAPDARHRASAEHAPAMNGEEKDELVTFDQQRQEGDLEHEGRNTPPTPPVQPAPEPQPAPPLPPAEAPARGEAQGSEEPDAEGKDAAESTIDATKSLTLTDDLSGQLKLQQEERPEQPPQELEQHAARKGAPDGDGREDTPAARPRRPRVFYDPSLAEWAQKPGFRTYERRSRSSGRFVLGRGAALNVASTPRGMYEALVYRRVAHFWYIACDEHRGDIIPGKITISLRITKRGQIDSMALITRRGASISQQSFTFKAIRKASLPPMPPEVQADVIGELMELIFEFNFD